MQPGFGAQCADHGSCLPTEDSASRRVGCRKQRRLTRLGMGRSGSRSATRRLRGGGGSRSGGQPLRGRGWCCRRRRRPQRDLLGHLAGRLAAGLAPVAAAAAPAAAAAEKHHDCLGSSNHDRNAAAPNLARQRRRQHGSTTVRCAPVALAALHAPSLRLQPHGWPSGSCCPSAAAAGPAAAGLPAAAVLPRSGQGRSRAPVTGDH